MKINDAVSLIDQDLQGTITSVHGEWVVFKDMHGFTHKHLKSELVLMDSSLYENMEVQPKQEPLKTTSKKHQKNHLVLDLHFDKLVSNPLAYESFERLFLQKEKLIETIEFCRTHHLKKLEIIHGLGDGVLQKLVVDYLENAMDLEFHHTQILAEQSASILVYWK